MEKIPGINQKFDSENQTGEPKKENLENLGDSHPYISYCSQSWVLSFKILKWKKYIGSLSFFF